jgi:hypothetical protein
MAAEVAADSAPPRLARAGRSRTCVLGKKIALSETLFGMKQIDIKLKPAYSVITAYEYHYLKGEDVVRKQTASATLYIIMQRPLVYFTNVRISNDNISFQIADDINAPLSCTFDPVANGLASRGSPLSVSVESHRKTSDHQQIYSEAAAIRIYDDNGKFLYWLSPQKFLHDVLIAGLDGNISGDPTPFLIYNVHYVGQAFDQRVWKRLTGHTRLQDLLTIEAVQGAKARRTSEEVCILLLSIVGYDEQLGRCPLDLDFSDKPRPIVHALDLNDTERIRWFNGPWLAKDARELTNEAEAMLISQFKPTHNAIKFENYPEISNGTRSVGYDNAGLTIDPMPVTLKTEHYVMATGADDGMAEGDGGN